MPLLQHALKNSLTHTEKLMRISAGTENVSYNQIYKDINLILNSAKYITTDITLESNREGTEGKTLNALVFGLLNSVGHIANQIKNLTTRFWKDLKRSELKYFHESNAASAAYIFTLKYDELKDKKIHYPEKLSVPFVQATTSVVNFLNYLDMSLKMKAIAAETEEMVTHILQNNSKVNFMGNSGVLSTNLRTNVVKEFDKLSKCFSGSPAVGGKDIMKPFKDLFKSTAEFKQVDTTILSAEKHYNQVSSIQNSIEKMETSLQRLIKSIEDKKQEITVPKDVLSSISAYTAMVARMCDMYGTALMDLMRLEHNFVLTLKSFKYGVENQEYLKAFSEYQELMIGIEELSQR